MILAGRKSCNYSLTKKHRLAVLFEIFKISNELPLQHGHQYTYKYKHTYTSVYICNMHVRSAMYACTLRWQNIFPLVCGASPLSDFAIIIFRVDVFVYWFIIYVRVFYNSEDIRHGRNIVYILGVRVNAFVCHTEWWNNYYFVPVPPASQI